jgi:hypothetical protein
VFGFDLAHIVFDAAFMAWVHPYIVLDILKGMLEPEPFFKPFFNHKTIFRLLFGVYIDEKNGSLNKTTWIFCPLLRTGGRTIACIFRAFRLYTLFYG